MKEFNAQQGGRYTYADDLENLQDLALAFGQIFNDCDNFIVSGCEIAGNSISSGYVYLNGKLRYFSGATNITSWPQYLYENNTTENVTYESGGSKIGRNIYGCVIGKSVPTEISKLTGVAPQSIVLTATGGIRMKDAFIGKYALLLNPSNNTQSVDSNVIFSKSVQLKGDVVANKSITITNGALKTTFNYSGSTFNVLSTGNSNTYQFSIIDGGGFQFYVNSTLVATIGDTIVFNKQLSAPQGIFGGLILTGNDFYQSTANALGELNINMLSYAGTTSQFRNTNIGNGKGKALVSILGQENKVRILANTQIETSGIDGVVLKSLLYKENNALVNSISWNDAANDRLATLGFINTVNQDFYVKCLYGIVIEGGNAVNIGPAIMENGVLLSEKYALQKIVVSELSKKADINSVYTKTESDSMFGAKGTGLSQFISSKTTAKKCRTQIGAIGVVELSQYAKLSNCLADMATSEAVKAKIRENIGAAGRDEFQTKLSDTGWVYIKDSLYIRQIGNIVSIQGKLKTVHSGTAFTIPNTIQAPLHSVKYTISFSNKCNWICKIDANQRACTVVYCDGGCNKNTEFSLTYMV